MAKLFGLTASQQKRVGRVVRERETSGPARANKSTDKSTPTGEFWAELTGEGTAGHYAWKKKYPKSPADGTYIDATPAVVVADFTAREMNLAGGLTGKIVKLTFIGYDAADKASYEFSAGSGDTQLPNGQEMFQVLTWNADGSTGAWYADFPRLHEL